MASMPIETSRLLALPLEILEEILLCLDRKSLKSVRATFRLGLKLATPKLFYNFTLYPHFSSFNRLLEISKRPEIASHVQIIIFDARFVGIPDMIHRQTRLLSKAGEEDKEIIEEVKLYARDCLRIDVAMDAFAQSSYLQKAFPAFVRLRKIIVRDAAPEGRHPAKVFSFELPQFYQEVAQKYCGRLPKKLFEFGLQEAQQCDDSYSLPILMSLHAMSGSLDEFQLCGFKWPGVLHAGDFQDHPQLLQSVLSSIKIFKLIEPQDVRFAGYGFMLSLQHLLMRTTNLEQLHIDFHGSCDVFVRTKGADVLDLDIGTVCQSYFDPPRLDLKISQLPSQLTWSSKIRVMKLEGMRCKSREMRSILKECSSTLEWLSLTRLLLLPDTTGGPLACLVKFLKWMQKKLNLATFYMGGFYTNGGMQYWSFYERLYEGQEILDGTGRNEVFELATLLLGRVENFVVNGGPCPIDNFAIPSGHFDLHKQNHDSKVPETVYEDDSRAGDLSWQLHYQEDIDDIDLDLLDAPLDDTSDLDPLEEEDDDDDEDEYLGPWGEPLG